MTTTDELIADYLERVRRAGAGLPPDRLDELITDLREHIAAARAELAPETEAKVRTLLDRLGDPAAIVAEAMVGAATPAAAPQPRSNRVLIIVLSVLAAILLLPLLLCLGAAAWLFPTRVQTDHGPVVEVSTQPAVESGE
jgi:uncharacterized membrane protein